MAHLLSGPPGGPNRGSPLDLTGYCDYLTTVLSQGVIHLYVNLKCGGRIIVLEWSWRACGLDSPLRRSSTAQASPK